MSAVECPPTPPTLPEGDAALTPPPKSPGLSDNESMSRKNQPSKERRPSSPDTKCAICLGNLENMSYTNACFHKFCFVCLLEWSKVKAECPLCKSKFKRIIHNIKSDDDYESYTLPPPPPRPVDPNAITIGDHEENRRFRYRTTMPMSLDSDVFQRERQELERLRAMAAEMYQWREQLPTLLPQEGPRDRLPTEGNPGQGHGQRISAGNLWRRRRGRATSEFRRDIYIRNLYVDPESISDITGRFRDCSPAWYRTNPAQTHRLVPWLSRELNVLLEGSQHQSAHVTQKILQLIERFEIRSPEFHEKLLPYLANRTDHFQHEFYHYARSVYDMVGYDRAATYTENQAPQDNVPVNVDEATDDEDIMVIDEVRRPDSNQGSSSRDTFPIIPLPPPPIDVDLLPSGQASTSASSTLLDLPLFDGPSTSTGISSSAPLHRLVIPASDSSDDTLNSVETNRKNKSQDDFVEIVDVVKPRHERTPEIIDLSSEVEATGSGEHSHKGKAKKQSIEAIEISSDSGAEVKNNTNAPAADSIASQSSDNEHKQAARRQLEDEIAARAEFKRILESERFTKRRILAYLQDYKKIRKPSSSSSGSKIHSNTKDKEETADKTWSLLNVEDTDSTGSSTANLPPEMQSRKNGKGKGKGKSSSKNKSKKSSTSQSSLHDEMTNHTSSRKKKKKHKKSSRPSSGIEPRPPLPRPKSITSSSDADDENEYHEKSSSSSRKSSKKQQKYKSKKKEKKKKKQKPHILDLHPSSSKNRKRKRASTSAAASAALTSSSSSEDEEKPLSRWKVSIKSSRKTPQPQSTNNSTAETSAVNSHNFSSNTATTKPDTAPEDLRLFLSRKRPRLKSEQSSTDDEPAAKAVRSVVVVPK